MRVDRQTRGHAGLWTAVDRLVDRNDCLDDLRAHRLNLLAARRWRASGRPVPAECRLEERRSAAAALTAPVLLQRVRDAYDGPLVLLKGPEVAACYPDAALRPYGDLDLLVPDAREAKRALLAAGFVAIGDSRVYENIHHERPLALPGMPLPIELHSVPKWPDGFAPPGTEELLEAVVPSALGIDGVATLRRTHHALVLAAHSWAHSPLRRVGELVDIALIADGVDAVELRALAARWGLGRIWKTTAAAVDGLVGGARITLPLRTWARHLALVRERTVLETHLERRLSDFWALPRAHALAAAGGALARDLAPSPGETVWAKVSRGRLAVRNAHVRRSAHVEQLERAGIRAPHFYEVAPAAPPDDRAALPAPRRVRL